MGVPENVVAFTQYMIDLFSFPIKIHSFIIYLFDHFRKLMVSKEPHVANFMDELGFSKLVLSYSPKSECAWSHR